MDNRSDMMNITEDKLIPVDEVKKSPRGRSKQLINGLTERLQTVEPGYALMLGQTFGNVAMKDRNKISTIIRKHWQLVRDDKPSINYTPEGIPQVSVRPE